MIEKYKRALAASLFFFALFAFSQTVSAVAPAQGEGAENPQQTSYPLSSTDEGNLESIRSPILVAQIDPGAVDPYYEEDYSDYEDDAPEAGNPENGNPEDGNYAQFFPQFKKFKKVSPPPAESEGENKGENEEVSKKEPKAKRKVKPKEQPKEQRKEVPREIRRAPDPQPVEQSPTQSQITPQPRPAEAVAITEEPQGDDMISLGNEMAIVDLIQLMSELTGETFLLDESVKSKRVTIVSPREGFKSRNAMRIFEAVLDLNGYAIVRKAGVGKIVNKRNIRTQDIPIEIGGKQTEPSSGYVTRVLQLKNVSALDVANTLKPFISKEGDIVAYPSSNTIIIVETRSNLNRILSIIDNIDLETAISFVKIENVDAGEIANKIIEIFSGGSAVSVPVSGGDDSERRSSRERRRTSRRTSRGGGEEGQQSFLGFKIVTDERTNTLIVAAHPEDMRKIREIIKKLDVRIDEPEQGIYVIPLQNADAEEVVSVLSSLISGSSGGRTTSSRTSQRQRQTGSTRSGSRTSATSRQTSSGLSTSLGSGSRIQREISGGLGLAGLVAETDGLRITAAPATNSIILISSRKDYEIIKDVISKLDVRRRQVFVEAAILEVSLDNLRSVGANFSIGATFNDDNLGFGGTVLPGVPSLLGIAANEGAVNSLLGNLSGLFLGIIGEEVDPDGSGPIPPIPSFSALFTALAAKTDVNILSTPSLLTTDNEEAEIVVADVIPFPTGSTIGDSGVTVQTIDREPVGIRLSITPQISEGDFLKLDIHTEVSSVREATVPGLNTQAFGIATTTRTADTSVVVKNGQTIVIGGLVQDRESTIENKVPLLGDIPILGRLFKFKQNRFSKINLLILITPRIVDTDQDMQDILEEKQRRNMLLQQGGG